MYFYDGRKNDFHEDHEMTAQAFAYIGDHEFFDYFFLAYNRKVILRVASGISRTCVGIEEAAYTRRMGNGIWKRIQGGVDPDTYTWAMALVDTHVV